MVDGSDIRLRAMQISQALRLLWGSNCNRFQDRAKTMAASQDPQDGCTAGRMRFNLGRKKLHSKGSGGDQTIPFGIVSEGDAGVSPGGGRRRPQRPARADENLSTERAASGPSMKEMATAYRQDLSGRISAFAEGWVTGDCHGITLRLGKSEPFQTCSAGWRSLDVYGARADTSKHAIAASHRPHG